MPSRSFATNSYSNRRGCAFIGRVGLAERTHPPTLLSYDRHRLVCSAKVEQQGVLYTSGFVPAQSGES